MYRIKLNFLLYLLRIKLSCHNFDTFISTMPFASLWIEWVMSVDECVTLLKWLESLATYDWRSARFPRGSRPPPPLPSWWCAAHSGCCSRGRRGECVPRGTWVHCPGSEINQQDVSCEQYECVWLSDCGNGNDMGIDHLWCSASFNAYFCIGRTIIISYSYLNWLPDKIQPAICTKFRIDFNWYELNIGALFALYLHSCKYPYKLEKINDL